MGIFRRGNKDEDKKLDLPIIGAAADQAAQSDPASSSGTSAAPDAAIPVTSTGDGAVANPDPGGAMSATGRRGFIGRGQRNSLPEIPTTPRAGQGAIISPPAAAPINPISTTRAALRDQICPTCSEVAPGDAKFCEACGTDLVGGEPLAAAPEPTAAATEPCVSCGADPSEIDDGYCSMCGTKQPAPRDHLEEDLIWIASVSDKGLRHHHNEDAAAISVADDAAVAVVCDGVSSTSRPEEASELAVDHIRDLLVQAVESGAAIEEAMRDAIESAHHQVAALADGGPGEAPSCTVVAAVLQPGDDGELHATLGWLGDSRAYWVNDAADGSLEATQLTVDHSWAIDQQALGTLDEEAIAADSRAHSITRWLGADSTDHTPDIIAHRATSGRLLLCTDGLWNYAAEGPAMAELLGRFPGTTLHTSQELVTFAKDSGGHDNITVALVDFAQQPDPLAQEAPPEPVAEGPSSSTNQSDSTRQSDSTEFPDETPSSQTQGDTND